MLEKEYEQLSDALSLHRPSRFMLNTLNHA
jgi:hypothetical protein